MKKTLVFLAFALFFVGCSSDDDYRNNPYLPNMSLGFLVDLDLPQYNDLKFPGNSITLRNYGINGVVIYNLNNSHFTAFELTDPNHIPENCSYLTVEGINAFCNCDDGNVYSIVTGQLLEGEGEYSLKPYRVVRSGNTLEISN